MHDICSKQKYNCIHNKQKNNGCIYALSNTISMTDNNSNRSKLF